MEIILIRHTSVAVERGVCYGQSDVAVQASFKDEAAITMQNMQQYMPFDHVFASPLTRARMLAKACGYENATIDHRLKEINMGEWEMKRYEDIEKTDPYILQWYNDYMNLPAKGGESFTDLYWRVADFLDELKQLSYQRVAIFAHGGVIVCAGIYAGLYPKTNAFHYMIDYGEQLVIHI